MSLFAFYILLSCSLYSCLFFWLMVSKSKVKEVPFTEPLVVVFLLAQSRDGAACPVALNREPTQLSGCLLVAPATLVGEVHHVCQVYILYISLGLLY